VVSPELLIFEQMAESVALYDDQGRFLYANPAALRRMAMTPEQVLGRSVWEIYPDAHDNDFSRTLRRVLETGQPASLEHHYPPWDAWFDNHFYASPLGVCVIALDITSRKRAEQEARALLSEKELEQRSLTRLFESIPAAVAVLRAPEWTYELSNAKNDELGGRGPLLGKRAPEVFPELVAQGFIGLLEQVSRSGEPYVATEVKVSVGSEEALREMYLNGVYQPMRDVTGEINRVMAFAYDVSEQVRARQRIESLAEQLSQSEARARRLSDSGVIGVVFWSRDGRLTDANDAFLSIVGYTRRELLEGHVRWSDMTPPEFAEADARAFAELDARGICTPYEKAYLTKDGRRVPILLGVALWEGSTDSGVAWVLDVSARRAIEAERDRLLSSERQARAAAEAANLSKDEFLAVISHELRTPLNAMLGWGRLLRGGTLDEARRERALEAIERNAQAQAQLIEDLLDVSRIVSGKLKLEIAPVDLARVVEEALDTVRPASESKGISLIFEVERALPRTMGDAHRLQQVAWNLLSNAVKFTPAGGQVKVSLRAHDAHLELSVTDSGQGIRASALPFIFETFRQGDASITRSFGGLGLGLSICRHLVELHGGSIEASSAGEGQGATFRVILGRDQPAAQPRKTPVSTPLFQSKFGGNAELAGLRVLVVDDEPDAHELVATILNQAGASVTTAASAADGLQLLTSAPFDVLLSDIGMPLQDGYELMRRVRRLPSEAVRRIPAAALTAYARSEDRAQAIAAGYQLHVTKPVDPTELTQVVASLAGIGNLLGDPGG
jgi:PAS domain S-box-containing protein